MRNETEHLGESFGKAWVRFWKVIRTDTSVRVWAPFAAFIFLFAIGVCSAFMARSYYIFTGDVW